MLRFLILGVTFLSTCGHAAAVDVAMETVAIRDARGICDKIVQSTELKALPSGEKPAEPRSRKSWDQLEIAEQERLIASAYSSIVDGLRSKDLEHDVQQTLGWYAKASLDGDLYAVFRLGILLGDWEKRNAEGAILIQAAADLGEYHARVYLGIEKEEY